MSLFDLTGKTAIITGSSRGIGEAIAEHFAAHGANVVISSRNIADCQAVADKINARSGDGNGDGGAGKAIAVAASISSKQAMEELVAATRAAFGSIDILVCNAASNPYYGPMAGITDEQLRKILDNNIVSNHWLVQLCAPDMIAKKDGAIIIISSIGGLRGSPVLGAYCISKAADVQLARNYAVEYGKHNVRVNCISPGLIKTEFARALWENPETEKQYASTHPMRRMGESEDLAGAAVFLASRAGAYVTGQNIVVDGGSTI